MHLSHAGFLSKFPNVRCPNSTRCDQGNPISGKVNKLCNHIDSFDGSGLAT
jgi:hypothetical protein